jgi:hypothetical protein
MTATFPIRWSHVPLFRPTGLIPNRQIMALCTYAEEPYRPSKSSQWGTAETPQFQSVAVSIVC